MSEDKPLTTRLPCQVHTGKHIPHPHINHRHHVWPLADGGPDVEENIVIVCPNGHANSHALLDLFRLHRGAPPYTELRTFAFGERDVAALGWKRLTRRQM